MGSCLLVSKEINILAGVGAPLGQLGLTLGEEVNPQIDRLPTNNDRVKFLYYLQDLEHLVSREVRLGKYFGKRH